MFTLAISCLATSNLPWFMDLTFQVPMQYCSLQHRTLLLSPVTGCCFCFGSISSLFLELFLHSSPEAYWAPTDLGSSSFSVLSFCLFILFMDSQGKNTEVVCHSLLQWTTFCQTSPPWPVHLDLLRPHHTHTQNSSKEGRASSLVFFFFSKDPGAHLLWLCHWQSWARHCNCDLSALRRTVFDTD